MQNKNYYFLLVLFVITLNVIFAQVDDYKMRYEQEYAQLKTQEVALTPQKIYSFTKEHTQNLHTSFADLLHNQTSFYLAKHNIFQSDIYYQNRRTSPTISIQNVDFSSTILENNFQWLQTIQPLAFESIQLYQGYSLTNLQMNSSQIALNYAIQPEKKDSFGNKVKVLANGSNMDYSGLCQFAVHKKKFNYLVNVYGGQNYRYELGQSGVVSPWLSWQRIANPYNGSISSPWSKQQDTLVNKQPQVFLGIDNLFNLKLSSQSEWNFYLHLAGRQESSLGNTIQKGNNYLYSESSNSFNPSIMGFIQKVNTSETSPCYSQLNLALTYQHLLNETTKRYDILDEQFKQHYEENKISLQLRAHKNFNARHILFYGSEASITFIKNKFHIDDAFTSFFDDPISKFTSYIKLEKRQSSDISWFLGAKGGLENSTFRHPPFVTQEFSKIRPHAELNVSFLRHICESSNYIINVFLRSKAPSLSEYNPILNHVFLKPNTNLTNETELLLESHLYRKFEDKLEIHLSPYFRHSWNTILLQDNFGNSAEKLRFGSTEFYTQSYVNHTQVNEGGAQLELRYNFSKKLLFYHQINFQYVWTPLDSNLFYPRLPLFGNLGLKYKSKKLFVHAWIHFNGGQQFSDTVSAQYIQYYGRPTATQKEFNTYFDFNIGIRYEIHKRISAQVNLENITNQYSLDYLSTLPNQGRRFRLQLVYSL